MIGDVEALTRLYREHVAVEPPYCDTGAPPENAVQTPIGAAWARWETTRVVLRDLIGEALAEAHLSAAQEVPDDVPARVLALPMPQPNEADAATIRDYLVALLRGAWGDDDFSGKRPFGNSGWRYDLYAVLLRAGMVEGRFDDDGYIEEVQRPEADALIRAAIERLGTL